MKAFACLALALGFLSSCSKNSHGLISDIYQYNQLSSREPSRDANLVRAEAKYRMYGQVSNAERNAKIGQYYTIEWQDIQPQSPAKLVFQYQIGKQGSKILSKTIDYTAGRKGGKTLSEFSFIGAEHAQNGFILSWKVTLFYNGKAVASRHSYLWQ